MNLILNIKKVGSAGTSHQYICHMFLEEKYIDSLDMEQSYQDSYIKGCIQRMAERRIVEHLTHKTGYSAKLLKGDDEKYAEMNVLHYDISEKIKNNYELLKQKFNELRKSSYFNHHSIRDIQPEFIDSTCVEIGGSYIREPEFNTIMLKQGAALEKFIEDVYGIKIKVTKYPGYNERESAGFGADAVKFYYEIKKITDKNKLKVEESNIDIKKKISELTITDRYGREAEGWRNIKNAKKPSKCIISLDDGIGLLTEDPYENMSFEEACARLDNPTNIWFLKDHEKEIMSDVPRYKKIVISKIGDHYVAGITTTLTNIKNIFPLFYKEMFGKVTPGLIACTIYDKYMAGRNEFYDERLNLKYEVPKLVKEISKEKQNNK